MNCGKPCEPNHMTEGAGCFHNISLCLANKSVARRSCLICLLNVSGAMLLFRDRVWEDGLDVKSSTGRQLNIRTFLNLKELPLISVTSLSFETVPLIKAALLTSKQ